MQKQRYFVISKFEHKQHNTIKIEAKAQQEMELNEQLELSKQGGPPGFCLFVRPCRSNTFLRLQRLEIFVWCSTEAIQRC